MIEEWKKVPDHEDYMVSNLGRVMSSRGKIMKGKMSRGYKQITFATHGHKYETVNLHRIVATLFVPNPDCLPQVNHLNEDKLDNRAENLEWCSAKQNINYGTRNKRVSLHQHGAKPVFVYFDNGERQWFKSQADAIRVLGLTTRGVWCCLHGSQKTTRGYRFEFA